MTWHTILELCYNNIEDESWVDLSASKRKVECQFDGRRIFAQDHSV